MKNVVDHRILIPRPSATVWQYLSDLSNNIHWQTDCESVSFLTSRRSGVGVRWRYRAPGGSDSVVETTAWYEGLGYEYSYIDSGSFDENRGRIRLQEIPEGTVVQWTFSYDTKGLIGGLRNTLSLRRQTEKVMMDSLRMLWRKLNQASGEPIREAKSLIRDAPGYEERSRYKPRHPSKLEVETSIDKIAEPPSEPMIEEPPVAEDDTRPSVRVAPSEPDFLVQVDESVDSTDVNWKRPVWEASPTGALESLPAAPPDPAPTLTAPVEVVLSPDEPEVTVVRQAAIEEPSSASVSAVVLSDESASQPPIQMSTKLHEKSVVVPSDTATSEPQIVENALSAPSPTAEQEVSASEKMAAMDTREISVFDIFGLPKPSETQELTPVIAFAQPAPPPPAVGRTGLRLILRRKLVNLRRPS